MEHTGGSEHSDDVPDAGVPGPGVDAPLFTTSLLEGLDEALRTFAQAGTVLVGLDFDGVLAPIVANPTRAQMLPTSAQAVAQLATLPGVTVALVSGRDVADLARLTDPPPGVWVVGSHGAERGTVVRDADEAGPGEARATRSPGEVRAAGAPALRTEPVGLTAEQAALHARLREQAEALVADAEGAWVQVKPTAVVVHTRTAARPDAERVTEAALTGPGALPGVRTMRGKEVVEMAVLEVTKGDAVQELRTQTGAQAVLYAGDDRTDEDAFAVLGPGDVSIKVGEGDSAAAYRLPDPEGVAAVLMRLVELRGGA